MLRLIDKAATILFVWLIKYFGWRTKRAPKFYFFVPDHPTEESKKWMN